MTAWFPAEPDYKPKVELIERPWVKLDVDGWSGPPPKPGDHVACVVNGIQTVVEVASAELRDGLWAIDGWLIEPVLRRDIS